MNAHILSLCLFLSPRQKPSFLPFFARLPRNSSANFASFKYSRLLSEIEGPCPLLFLPWSPTKKGEVHPFLRVQRGSILIRQMDGRGREKIRETESAARSLIQSCRNEPSDSIIQAVIYILAEDENRKRGTILARFRPGDGEISKSNFQIISALCLLALDSRRRSDSGGGEGDSLTVIL